MEEKNKRKVETFKAVKKAIEANENKFSEAFTIITPNIYIIDS